MRKEEGKRRNAFSFVFGGSSSFLRPLKTPQHFSAARHVTISFIIIILTIYEHPAACSFLFNINFNLFMRVHLDQPSAILSSSSSWNEKQCQPIVRILVLTLALRSIFQLAAEIHSQDPFFDFLPEFNLFMTNSRIIIILSFSSLSPRFSDFPPRRLTLACLLPAACTD